MVDVFHGSVAMLPHACKSTNGLFLHPLPEVEIKKDQAQEAKNRPTRSNSEIMISSPTPSASRKCSKAAENDVGVVLVNEYKMTPSSECVVVSILADSYSDKQSDADTEQKRQELDEVSTQLVVEKVEKEEEKIACSVVKPKGDPKRIMTEKLVVGRDCNAILIADTVTKEALLIDPGGDSKVIMEWIGKMRVKVVQILVTHAHFDHILAADKVRRCLKAPIWLHKDDVKLWRQLPEQMALLGLKRRGARCVKRLPDPNFFLEDGDKLKILGGVTIHTPGHTPGSVCFYFEDYDLLISGDTLFKAHVGRTDLPGGNSAALRRSVLYKLYKLPRETRVLPGHGRETNIGYEMENNRSCRLCTCKHKSKSAKATERATREMPPPKSMDCTHEKTPTHCHTHSSGGNHSENHVSTSGDGQCCDEADEGDEGEGEACRCGAETVPPKHQHVGEDMCSVL